MDAAVTLVVFVGVFALMYGGAMDRHMAMLTGAAVILGYGLAADFFSLSMAVDSIYFETLALIFGMSAISAVLARSGLFAVTAARVAGCAAGDGWWVLVLFSLVTYAFSLTVNNLAAMVVVLPVTVTLCRSMGLNPVPVVIAEIIASNLGGASTMIGDFPNMIISAAGHLRFFDFIGGMMVPCLVLLAVMLGYFQSRKSEVGRAANGVLPKGPKPAAPLLDTRLVKVGGTILGAVLVGFLISDTLGLRPGWVALAGGIAALYLGGHGETDWFAACGGPDILFFGGLFVMVGGLTASGVLDGVVDSIEILSGGRGLPQMLALMWLAAAATIFLNAGAATAFLVPIATTMYASLSDPAVWWSLSLGVLAGSSAALTGATAGAVAATHLDRFIKDHPEMRSVMGAGLDFKGYLNWGLPIMGLFLGLSSLYIAVVAV